MAFDWGGIGDIIGGDSLVGAAEENVGREFAAYNGNIRREVHTQHAQHAFFCWFVLLSLLLMSFVRFTRHSSVTLRRKGRRRHKFGSFLEKTTRAEEGGTQADPPFTWPEYPPSLTGPETWPWKCHRIRCGSWRRSEPISASGQRERERDWKNHKWLVRFRKVIVKWIDGRFNRDWEGKVRVLERDREREQLTIRVLQRKKWEK